MKRICLFLTITMAFTHAQAPPADPAWWSQGNPPVIVPGAEQNNKGPANIGQAKYMVKCALESLSTVSPTLASSIEADLVGPGKALDTLVVPVTPSPEWKQAQKAPLLVGQLKAISAPFYNQINSALPQWLETQRIQNGTNLAGTHLPWSQDTHPENKSMATNGQLKAVFALRFNTLVTDSDGDGLTDTEENRLGTNPYHDDSDNDGIKDKTELLSALDPLNPDTDGDQLTDGFEPTILTIPTNPDTDNDTISDGEEIASGTNPLLPDTDGDGLTDAQEKNLHTNPLLADTDGDGINDGTEITTGTNPLSNDTDLDSIADGQDPQPLHNSIFDDPDRIGLPSALIAGMTSLWDFENIQQLTQNNQTTPAFANLINAAQPAHIFGPAIATPGMISRSARFYQPTHCLIAPPQTLAAMSNWSVSFWYKIPTGSIQNNTGHHTTFWAYNNSDDAIPEIIVHADKATTSQAHQKIIITLSENGTSQIDHVANIPLTSSLDNNTWQQLTVTKHNGTLTLYRNAINILQCSTTSLAYTPETSGYFAIGRAHQTATEDTAFHGEIDRFTIHNRALLASEVDVFYNLDSDNDDIPDRIESATAIWRDHNGNGQRENNETVSQPSHSTSMRLWSA